MLDKNKNTHSAEQPFFALQKIYIKSSSFEAPNAAKVFKQNWKPEISLDLNVSHESIGDSIYEVVLSISVTAKNDGILAFLVEVDQAALFVIKGFPEQKLDEALNSACPLVMFPYIRETLDTLMLKGCFPPLMLAPVNFDALYTEKNRACA
ncbi:protein-export chaperone SecB [Pseudomonas sp. LH1G9]|uniref:protein-export chaperone SecB n=1 Tax=Pseudomonas sp. LH1G9 TaxID=2083055 RepID=UPI000CF3477E|nr:protein-export chaperone SecB [Pseudomonas sp. LH1G9]